MTATGRPSSETEEPTFIEDDAIYLPPTHVTRATLWELFGTNSLTELEAILLQRWKNRQFALSNQSAQRVVDLIRQNTTRRMQLTTTGGPLSETELNGKQSFTEPIFLSDDTPSSELPIFVTRIISTARDEADFNEALRPKDGND